MPQVIFVAADGERFEIALDNGYALMEGAVRAGVPGINADCGGACACATCHVHIAGAWAARVGPAGEAEADMLEFADDVRPNSRLSCQIVMREEWDGLIVHVASAG